jgi:hypothetical protein
VISKTICLGDHRFRLVVGHRGGGLVHHLHSGRVRGGRYRQNVALHPRNTLVLVDNGLTGNGLAGNVKSLVSFISDCVRNRSGAASSKRESKRLEGKSEK